MRLYELGQRIKQQRVALDLTQEQVARLSDLSRTTVNQLENGSLGDLGFSKVVNLLGILGLDLQARPAKGLANALSMAAQTASTSYKKILTPDALMKMLDSGEVPSEYRAHVMTLLDETPLPILMQAISEAAARSPSGTPRKIMRHLSKWANEFHAQRMVW